MAKIERKYMAHYINAAAPGAEAPDFQRLGKDLEEFSPEMSANVETTRNILGQTQVNITGYEKTASVEPFFAEKGSALFERLQAIIDGDLVLDDLKSQTVDVKLWEGEAGGTTFPAVREEVYIEVTSYGGGTEGYQIPFTIHYTGVKAKGTFDVKTNTFTEENAENA